MSFGFQTVECDFMCVCFSILYWSVEICNSGKLNPVKALAPAARSEVMATVRFGEMNQCAPTWSGGRREGPSH
jgi:hypothetical protein